jgi:anhydro-N-acetylmuramic acid kinase
MTTFLDKLVRKCRSRTMRVAGLMSGTSADGVDVAIVDCPPRAAMQLVAFDTFAYPPAVRQGIFDLFDPATGRVDQVCHLNAAIGEIFAEALITLARRHAIALDSIDLVGSHGQTVHHLPEGRRLGRRTVRSTLQIGEPSIIAERTGITTVADFRPRDMAAGGQGAPLVPYTDLLLFGHRRLGRAVQNIGGIANVTWLPPAAGPDDVMAFDTGPGNMLIDRLAWHVSGGRLKYDRDGAIAGRGSVDETLLADLLRHPFFRRRPPKSTGREEFGLPMADQLWQQSRRRRMPAENLLATVTALTARSIARAYRRFLPGNVDEAIICGGGARNPTLLAMLREQLAPARVVPMDDLGLSADAKEAVSFAILARETVLGRPGNIIGATGARRRVVLGKIIPGGAPPDQRKSNT